MKRKTGVLNCICNKQDKRICVGHQRAPKKERDREMRFIGQEIWLNLEKYGFVGREDGLHYQLTPREEKLQNWLIWGKWKKD